MSTILLTAVGLSVRALAFGPRPGHCRALRRGLTLGALSGAAALAGTALSPAADAVGYGPVLAFAALSYVGGRLLLDAVLPPEEQASADGALLRRMGLDALLTGLALPVLAVPPVWAVGAVGGSCCAMGALSALLPQGVRSRLLPWLCALGGLALTCVGMGTLLKTLL